MFFTASHKWQWTWVSQVNLALLKSFRHHSELKRSIEWGGRRKSSKSTMTHNNVKWNICLERFIRSILKSFRLCLVANQILAEEVTLFNEWGEYMSKCMWVIVKWQGLWRKCEQKDDDCTDGHRFCGITFVN